MSAALYLPESFRAVPYRASCVPGNVPVAAFGAGANCQLFAYALLEHYGVTVPPCRSSDLWADTRYSRRVEELEPLDLLLWNATDDPYGAHVGVYLGAGEAVHLSRLVGFPTVWSLTTFLGQPSYRCFLGAKRIL